ncbi:MAG TPA: hypothetical protein VF190_08855 [Rhodothermales bacterium]
MRKPSTTLANVLLVVLAGAMLARSEANVGAPVDDWSRLAQSASGDDVLLGAEVIADFHFLQAPPPAVPTAVQREASASDGPRSAASAMALGSISGAAGRCPVPSPVSANGTDAPRALYVLHSAYLL